MIVIIFCPSGSTSIIGKHAVEPLWWLNPLDYAYNEDQRSASHEIAKTRVG